MTPLQSIALIIGLLLIATRLPGIFEPKKYLHWLGKTFVKKKRFRMLGIISLLFFAIFFYYLIQESTLIEALTSFFIILALIWGLIALIIPELPVAMFSSVTKQSDTAIRVMCSIVVIIGVCLVYLALAQ